MLTGCHYAEPLQDKKAKASPVFKIIRTILDTDWLGAWPPGWQAARAAPLILPCHVIAWPWG